MYVCVCVCVCVCVSCVCVCVCVCAGVLVARVVILTDTTLCMQSALHDKLQTMRKEATEANIIAGELLDDTKRRTQSNMVAETDDEAKQDESSDGKKRRTRTRKKVDRLDPSSSTPGQQSKPSDGGDITESDDDADVEQSCAGCSGVFNYFNKDDCTRFRCFKCGPAGGLLLCKVCVKEHRAENSGHRCRQRKKTQLRLPPPKRNKRKPRGKGEDTGGNSNTKPVREDQSSAPAGGKRTKMYSAADEEELVRTYEHRRALYAPAYHEFARKEQFEAQTQRMQAQVKQLEMQIQIEELERKLEATKKSLK